MAETSLAEKEIHEALRGQALDAVVRQLFEVSWGKARQWIETGKISLEGVTLTDGRVPVTAPVGAKLRLNMNAPRPLANRGGRTGAPAAPLEGVVHLDSQLIVVDKPSGISTVPFDEKEKDTLQSRICAFLKTRKIEVVHRIDKETSGLVVFARTFEASRKLANQFRFHSVHRRYLALAHGVVRDRTIESVLLENRGDGLRGSARPGQRVAPGEGKTATTHVRALRVFQAGTPQAVTLVECRLETGRTHQIRIHLSECGHPLLGERLYIRDFRGPALSAPRVMLHAAELGFVHPASGAPMSWKCEPPADFRERFEALG